MGRRPLIYLRVMTMVKIRNLIKALSNQLPLSRAFKNFFITRNAWGMFHKSSHIVASTGNPKVQYNTYASAQRASKSMKDKYGGRFAAYKCIYCDGYHVGKNKG